MLAGRDSPSPISSVVSESEERMSYLNTLAVQERLAESGLPLEMFGSQNLPAELRLETEQEDQDGSEYTVPRRLIQKLVRMMSAVAFIGNRIREYHE